MNDKEKVEAIRKTLSLNIEGLKTYSRYVGLIHDIMDDKMTMKEVDVYIRDNFWICYSLVVWAAFSYFNFIDSTIIVKIIAAILTPIM